MNYAPFQKLIQTPFGVAISSPRSRSSLQSKNPFEADEKYKKALADRGSKFSSSNPPPKIAFFNFLDFQGSNMNHKPNMRMPSPSPVQQPLKYEVSPEDEQMVDQYIENLNTVNPNNLTYEQNLDKYKQ